MPYPRLAVRRPPSVLRCDLQVERGLPPHHQGFSHLACEFELRGPDAIKQHPPELGITFFELADRDLAQALQGGVLVQGLPAGASLSPAPDLTYRPLSARLAKTGLVLPMRDRPSLFVIARSGADRDSRLIKTT